MNLSNRTKHEYSTRKSAPIQSGKLYLVNMVWEIGGNYFFEEKIQIHTRSISVLELNRNILW